MRGNSWIRALDVLTFETQVPKCLSRKPHMVNEVHEAILTLISCWKFLEFVGDVLWFVRMCFALTEGLGYVGISFTESVQKIGRC